MPENLWVIVAPLYENGMATDSCDIAFEGTLAHWDDVYFGISDLTEVDAIAQIRDFAAKLQLGPVTFMHLSEHEEKKVTEEIWRDRNNGTATLTAAAVFPEKVFVPA